MFLLLPEIIQRGKTGWPESCFSEIYRYFYYLTLFSGHKLQPMRFFDFFNGTNKKDPAIKAPDSNPTGQEQELREQAAAFLHKYAPRYPGLDYSVGSLAILEDLLHDANGFYGEMTVAQQQKIIEGAGAYLFEVARSNVGGTYYWYQKLNQPILITGQPEFETGILAFNQVRNRLKNGPEDSIPVYFEGYLDCVQQRRSAVII